jgi:hypothetical protein
LFFGVFFGESACEEAGAAPATREQYCYHHRGQKNHSSHSVLYFSLAFRSKDIVSAGKASLATFSVLFSVASHMVIGKKEKNL